MRGRRDPQSHPQGWGDRLEHHQPSPPSAGRGQGGKKQWHCLQRLLPSGPPEQFTCRSVKGASAWVSAAGASEEKPGLPTAGSKRFCLAPQAPEYQQNWAILDGQAGALPPAAHRISTLQGSGVNSDVLSPCTCTGGRGKFSWDVLWEYLLLLQAVKKYRVDLGFKSILVRKLGRVMVVFCVSCPQQLNNTTFWAADGLISSQADQRLTTVPASPTSFPQSSATYYQWVLQ